MTIIFGVIGLVMGLSLYLYPFGHTVTSVYVSEISGVVIGAVSLGFILGHLL